MKKIIIFLIIIIVVGLISFGLYQEGSLPVNKADSQPVIFVINPGDSLDTTIINKLAKENLIRSRLVFYLIVKQKGIEKKIQAGDFRLYPNMSASEIADELTHGTLDIWVTLPEGLRKEEIAEILSEKLGISETEFNELAIEGTLYPDTYLIPKNPKTQQVVDILTSTQNQKFTSEMEIEAMKKNLSRGEVITLASILEREAVGAGDRQQIANILFRRLKEGIPLQVDATVQYVLGYQPQEKRWWKKVLSFDDLKIQSPYNTYISAELPPGPISNPGISSIKAVVEATEKTPYLFYLHDPTGQTRYGKTAEEHQQNINKYLK